MGGPLDDAISVLGNRDGMGRNRVPCRLDVLSDGASMRKQLELSHDEWHKLSLAVDTRRARVSVPREVLERLMRDHSHLIALHKGEVIE